MKICFKSFVSGVIVATVGVASVFAAAGIKSADFNANKVVFDGKELDLSSQPMISVVKEGETNASNYMPVRAVLEAMGYEVSWDGQSNSVLINTNKAAATAEPKLTADPEPTVDPEPTTPLTADALDGYWNSKQYDMDATYAILKDGTIQCLETSGEGDEMFISGTYVIDGDAINASFNYLYDNGDVEELSGDDIIELYMRLRFVDGKLEWWDEEYPLTMTKLSSPVDFSEYEE